MNNINCNTFLGKFPATGFRHRGMNKVEDENDGRFDVLLWRKDASFDDGRGRDNDTINSGTISIKGHSFNEMNYRYMEHSMKRMKR